MIMMIMVMILSEDLEEAQSPTRPAIGGPQTTGCYTFKDPYNVRTCVCACMRTYVHVLKTDLNMIIKVDQGATRRLHRPRSLANQHTLYNILKKLHRSRSLANQNTPYRTSASSLISQSTHSLQKHDSDNFHDHDA